MILITGGAGYIGSICALYFLKKGYKVVVFDNLSTGNDFAVKKLSKYKKFYFVKGDLLNIKDLTKLFKCFKIKTCIHLAACSKVSESEQNPEKYYAANIYGTLNLLAVMNDYNVKNIIFASSAAVYGDNCNFNIKEDFELKPSNIYGKTKMIIEKILDNYEKTCDIKSVKLRYFNVIGADFNNLLGECHELESHLVPNILKSILKKEKFKINGVNYNTKDGSCVRDFVDVGDLARANFLALKYLENKKISNTFNICTGKEYSVFDVIKICEDIVGEKVLYEIKPARKSDCARLIGSNKKAEKILGWNPEKQIQESVKNAYKWEKHISLEKY